MCRLVPDKRTMFFLSIFIRDDGLHFEKAGIEIDIRITEACGIVQIRCARSITTLVFCLNVDVVRILDVEPHCR